MQHSWHTKVVNIRIATGNLFGDIEPPNGMPDEREQLGRLRCHRTLGVQGNRKPFPLYERRVRDRFSAGRRDSALTRVQLSNWYTEAPCRSAEERGLCRGSRLSDLRASDLHGQASVGGSLVGR